MRKFLLVVVILSLGLICVFGEPTGILKGKVIDATTKEPVKNAIVIIDKLNLGAVTDAEGYYVIGGVRIGFHDVEFLHPSYNVMVKQSVGLASNVATTLNAELIPGSTDVEVINRRKKQIGEN